MSRRAEAMIFYDRRPTLGSKQLKKQINTSEICSDYTHKNDLCDFLCKNKVQSFKFTVFSGRRSVGRWIVLKMWNCMDNISRNRKVLQSGKNSYQTTF